MIPAIIILGILAAIVAVILSINDEPPSPYDH